jgi:hypothetical protein
VARPVGQRQLGAVGVQARHHVDHARVQQLARLRVARFVAVQQLVQPVQAGGAGRQLGGVDVAVDPERRLVDVFTGVPVGDASAARCRAPRSSCRSTTDRPGAAPRRRSPAAAGSVRYGGRTGRTAGTGSGGHGAAGHNRSSVFCACHGGRSLTLPHLPSSPALPAEALTLAAPVRTCAKPRCATTGSCRPRWRATTRPWPTANRHAWTTPPGPTGTGPLIWTTWPRELQHLRPPDALPPAAPAAAARRWPYAACSRLASRSAGPAAGLHQAGHRSGGPAL